MRQCKIEDSTLCIDIDKLLLYLAFYGGLKERRLMAECFEILSKREDDKGEGEYNKAEKDEDESLDRAEELIRIICHDVELEIANLDREYAKLRQILEEKKIKFISVLDDDYPPLLREIKGYPFGLFYKGDVSLLSKPCVSVVGSRKASYDASKMCDNIARHLKKTEVSVASGLAFGVDSFIHKACLRHGVKTISVLPSCVDKPIPVNNRKIAFQILEAGGLLISENPPNFNVRPASYVERNRIISGISDRTLVVEAAIKSGSMTTAKFAIEQNRDLYAMVGSISNPVAKGTNYLISQGAKPLVYAEDFYELIEEEAGECAGQTNDDSDNKSEKDSNLNSSILDFIREHGRVEIDEIISNVNLTEVEVISKLTEYEIFGYIRRQGNYLEIME